MFVLTHHGIIDIDANDKRRVCGTSNHLGHRVQLPGLALVFVEVDLAVDGIASRHAAEGHERLVVGHKPNPQTARKGGGRGLGPLLRDQVQDLDGAEPSARAHPAGRNHDSLCVQEMAAVLMPPVGHLAPEVSENRGLAGVVDKGRFRRAREAAREVDGVRGGPSDSAVADSGVREVGTIFKLVGLRIINLSADYFPI